VCNQIMLYGPPTCTTQHPPFRSTDLGGLSSCFISLVSSLASSLANRRMAASKMLPPVGTTYSSLEAFKLDVYERCRAFFQSRLSRGALH
jgi:hypothetical protein